MTDTPPRRGLLALFVLVFLACCALASALPHDRYIRYQQFDGTIMAPLRWGYERLHYDRTPIDVAIIGASRTEIGVSAPQVEAQLSAQLGRPVHVANFSVPQDGRDLHYVVTRELLATHPEVRLILYSLIEHASRTGQPAFRNIADTGDVLDEPLLINSRYIDNLAFLPFRQLSLFLQTRLPGLFGVRRDFDPAHYLGTERDTTRSRRGIHGNWIDRDSIHSAAELAQAAKGKVSLRNPIFLPPALRDYEYAIERQYTRKAVSLAHAAAVQVGFVYLPIYAHAMPIADLPFYKARGFVMSGAVIAEDSRDYSDYAHLNRNGSAKVSRWIATQLAARARAGHLHLLPEERTR